jgi:hypothetical protein
VSHLLVAAAAATESVQRPNDENTVNIVLNLPANDEPPALVAIVVE